MSEPRHVAFLLQQLRGGGVPRMTLNLADELVRRGLRVTVLAALSGGGRAGDVPAGVAVRELDAGGLARLSARSRRRKWRAVAATPALVSFLRSERPDALVSADHWPNFVAVVARACEDLRLGQSVVQDDDVVAVVGEEIDLAQRAFSIEHRL